MPPESPSPTAGPRSCGERNRDSADVCGETYTCDRCRQRMEIDRLRACADALRAIVAEIDRPGGTVGNIRWDHVPDIRAILAALSRAPA